ncbi:NACHT, LRR and PYD domains-containing protein 9 [Myotis daubentonii]|uniref:NACHT, LRR and PYD domains-containing protein 9 n=1 Tax=Myotis daubentonii TaxID=98922 RepID=UPI0028739B0B|nr:NACHT, LRR and PYD domains-containing protein 9 [Myotis daubentonii]
MAEAFFSDICLLSYLKELRKNEFWKFKELLKQEPKQSDLRPIPWPELKRASKDDLANLLCRHYPGKQAWEVALRLFPQVNRRDLWAKGKDEIRNKINPYKSNMRKKFSDIWQNETCLVVPESFYAESTKAEYERLSQAFAADKAGEHSVTVALVGAEGTGKTTLLRKVMLQWAEGNLWKGRFTFVFFLNCCEMNIIDKTSLVEFLSGDWPESSEPIHDVFSQPEKILFVIDGLDDLKVDVGLDGDLCSDWEQPRPVHVVLRSLLQRTLLPEASLLVSLSWEWLRKFYHLLRHPVYVYLCGFSGDLKWLYFSRFFQDTDQAAQAFSVVRGHKPLFSLCQYPLVCWLVCECLKKQLQRCQPLGVNFQTTTCIYSSFLTSVFQPERMGWAPGHCHNCLKCLCALAAEGTWAGRFAFQPSDLEENSVSEADALAWVRMRLLRQNGSLWVFPHQYLQESCTALWYLLRLPGEPQHPRIGSATQLVTAVMTEAPFYLKHTALFLFGFATERVAGLLEAAWGLGLDAGLREEITQCLRGLSQQVARSELQINFQNLFSCVFETQDPGFTTQLMSMFQDMEVYISKPDDLMTYACCLQHALNLQTLHLSLENVFAEDCRGLLDNDQKLSCWQALCCAFTNSRDFQMLDLDGCVFNEASQAILWRALAQPTCKLQKLVYNFASNVGESTDFFKALVHNPHLTYLNLHGTNLSSEEVALLSEALRHPMCSIQQLMLGKCDITDEACEDIAVLLVSSRKLKLVSLMENPVMDSGALLLSEALKHPDCVLESLLLTYCCLTSDACDYIAQALVRSTTLSLLDLGSNFLEDSGVKLLCEALGQPSCNLQQLWLVGCYLTPVCCEDLSTVLISNEKLKTLKLGDNKIQDAGVKQLCGALKHPNCKLENLGLELCELTTACCEDLASALTVCKSLRGLNLEWNSLDHDGMVVLCEALDHQDCALQLLGLDKDAFEAETQYLLKGVEERNPQLTICSTPWNRDELMLKGVIV